ncbi:LOW QUALITY PROTEIN: tRNA wybutosine-synthesizing protein 4-like [Aegotheles albertisi]
MEIGERRKESSPVMPGAPPCPDPSAEKPRQKEISIAMLLDQFLRPFWSLMLLTGAGGGEDDGSSSRYSGSTSRRGFSYPDHQGSTQQLELRAIVEVFSRWKSTPVNVVCDSLYVVGVVSRIERALLKEEWHLKCSPYFVLTASKGMEPSWTPLLPSMTVPGHDGPVRSAGSVTAAVCAVHSEISGLGRYGHCSVLIKPNVILTTGGFGEEDGQHCHMRSFHMLIKHAGCWKAGCLKKENPDKRWDERLYHSVLCLLNSLALLVGGRTSPSSAGLGMLGLKLPETCNASDPDDTSVEPVSLQPEPAALRWRHSATEVIFKGEKYLFLYGGCSAMEPVLGWCFLHTRELSCTVIPVEGAVPESRHSHSACSWKGGALIAGGLGAAEQPLGSVFFLRELEHGFQWQRVETRPPLIPRYSHTAHVHDGKLLLVGGVFHSSSVPGITGIDIMTGLCLNCTINVEHLEWPLMLHNHSSVFLPNEEEMLLVGGGGNCFSFGTHLNPEPVSLSLSSILTSH